ncbi:hypothetical protein B0J14DRAFT_674567 [Halenospora varia]|nr:hypothetical protein B0J14DRAFT_674567 [Halenospora varia]
MNFSLVIGALALSSGALAQGFTCTNMQCTDGNGNAILSCRGSQWQNNYCCVDGEFSGPAVEAYSSSRNARQSSRAASRSSARASATGSYDNNKRELVKRVVVEMSSGLTCNVVAAVTLVNNPNASVQLASATSAAGAYESGMTVTVIRSEFVLFTLSVEILDVEEFRPLKLVVRLQLLPKELVPQELPANHDFVHDHINKCYINDDTSAGSVGRRISNGFRLWGPIRILME